LNHEWEHSTIHARLETRIPVFFGDLLSSWVDVRDVPAFGDTSSFFPTQPASRQRFFHRPLRRPDDLRVKQVADLPAVMDVRPGHDEGERDATPVHEGVAFAPIFSLSAGFGPTDSFAGGALTIVPSADCHSHAMPSIPSYSASPAFQTAVKNPAAAHPWNRLCRSLDPRPPNFSRGKAFQMMPVRRTYTMTAKYVLSSDLGFLPPPGSRR
jgi:hypothetical protein